MTVALQSAVLLEELAEAAGIARQQAREILDVIGERFGAATGGLRQRVSAIMAGRSGSLEDRLELVADVTEENLDSRVKARIFAALGLGVIGGFVLSAAAGSVVAWIVGIALIFLAGYMLKDMIRIVMNQIESRISAFSIGLQ